MFDLDNTEGYIMHQFDSIGRIKFLLEGHWIGDKRWAFWWVRGTEKAMQTADYHVELITWDLFLKSTIDLKNIKTHFYFQLRFYQNKK